MTAFAYTAIDAATGRATTGKLECSSEATAIADLKARGLCPTGMSEVKSSRGATAGGARAKARAGTDSGQSWRFRKAVGKPERMVFTRQLAALVGAGMPLVHSLDLLARQE